MDDIPRLTEACREAQAGRDPDSAPCTELFRRALVEEDQAAWQAVGRIFHGLIAGWVHRYSLYDQIDEAADVFVNEGLLRLWRSGSVLAREGRFRTLGDYLGYLRRCVWSALEDYIRKYRRDGLWKQAPLDPGWGRPVEAKPVPGPEAAAAEREVVEALLETLWDVCAEDEAARVIAEESWVYGLPPRKIYEKHKNRFGSVKEVNQIKLNLIRKLKRHRVIKEISASMD